MCGRFAITVAPSMIAGHFNLTESIEFPPNYNITPALPIPLVRSIDGARSLSLMRWGLIPPWAKDEKIGYKLINARSETVFQKPAFRAAVKSRRCLIPASGFFEWKKIGTRKQPFYVTVVGQELFSFAGIWEIWHKSEKETIASCSILTTAANALMAPIHDRMPAIIAPDNYKGWMGAASEQDTLRKLLLPFPAEAMQVYAVGSAVNNPGNNGPACLVPLQEN